MEDTPTIHLENIITELKANISELRAENEKLFLENRQIQNDKLDITKYLQQKNDEYEERLQEMLQRNVELEETITTIRSNVAQEWSLKLADLQNEIALRDETISQYEQEKKGMQNVKAQNVLLRSELDAVVARQKRMEDEQREQISKLEHLQLQEKEHLLETLKREEENASRRALQDAWSVMDSATANLYQEKQKQDIITSRIQQENVRLERENEGLTSALNERTRELDIERSALSAKTRVSAKQAKEIVDLQHRVGKLEGSLERAVKDFSREKELAIQKAALEVEDAKLEVEALQHLLELKGRELTNIKLLAQNVLNQRTDVENFLLDSLELVRRELAKEHETPPLPMHEPTLKRALFTKRGSASIQKPGVEMPPPHLQVDIHDLTWAQRERVLRVLFAKINQCRPTSQRHSMVTNRSLSQLTRLSPTTMRSGTSPTPHQPPLTKPKAITTAMSVTSNDSVQLSAKAGKGKRGGRL
eukprot:gnl/Trimastix_PCT/3409.p1 GENE.gnl/Trimastix_PCT/3409~~gnl/Trimastix_PCT/3409.p1  ORF type:complete len:503 (-),score=114.87 gnl/Trimastix_PCT/3409:120-1550(-)